MESWEKSLEEVFLSSQKFRLLRLCDDNYRAYNGLYQSEATKFGNGTMKIDYYRHNKLINSKVKFPDHLIYHIERDIDGEYKYIRYSLVGAVKNSRRGGCVLV